MVYYGGGIVDCHTWRGRPVSRSVDSVADGHISGATDDEVGAAVVVSDIGVDAGALVVS